MDSDKVGRFLRHSVVNANPTTSQMLGLH